MSHHLITPQETILVQIKVYNVHPSITPVDSTLPFRDIPMVKTSEALERSWYMRNEPPLTYEAANFDPMLAPSVCGTLR